MNLKPLVIAHRGASGHAPENTLEAYRLALQMGADGIEMDVHRLRDGVIVAIHDSDVKRTTNGCGQISDLTLAELNALDAGSWFNDAFPEKARPEYAGLRVPALREILDLVKESPVELYIEIKNPEFYAPDLESSLLSLIRGNQLGKRAHLVSFSPQPLRRIKDIDREIQTALLISNLDKDPVHAALKVAANELGILYTLVTPAIIDAAQKNGLSIASWTVDEQADMERMMRLGVDSIITNYPDRLLELLGRAKTGQKLPDCA